MGLFLVLGREVIRGACLTRSLAPQPLGGLCLQPEPRLPNAPYKDRLGGGRVRSVLCNAGPHLQSREARGSLFPICRCLCTEPTKVKARTGWHEDNDPARRPRRDWRVGRAPRPPSGLADQSPAVLWQNSRASCPWNGTLGRYLWPRRHGSPAPRDMPRGSGYGLNACVPAPHRPPNRIC